jgi:hypothetical protein
MSTTAITDIYARHIQQLSAEQRLQLLALIAQQLAAETPLAEAPRTHSILELDGLGMEIWDGVDAQEYVNALRAEWDERRW